MAPANFVRWKRMIYTLEKKTQRERLNERLRSSLDSTQSRIRNAPFFLKFKIRSNAKIVLGFRIFSNFFLSTAEFKIFQQLFCFQPLGLRFFSNFLSFNHWKIIFLENILHSTAGLMTTRSFRASTWRTWSASTGF